MLKRDKLFLCDQIVIYQQSHQNNNKSLGFAIIIFFLLAIFILSMSIAIDLVDYSNMHGLGETIVVFRGMHFMGRSICYVNVISSKDD